MINFNKFINEAGPLFDNYRILNNDEINCSSLKKIGSYIAIAGNYYLNRSYNGEIFYKMFYLVIILDKTRQIKLPIVWLPQEIKPNNFAHMYSDNTCCLGLNHEIMKLWGPNQNAVDFFDNVIDIFLINYLSFKRNGRCATQERPHGTQGVINYYENIFNLPYDQCAKILPFILSNAKRKELAHGHNVCPCGSGKKLRNCHGNLINGFLRELFASDDCREAFIDDVKMIV